MSFDVDNGYAPRTFEDILAEYVTAINEEMGTDYTPETIIGTDWYKYIYVGIQLILNCENRVAEIGSKISDYITYINDSIKMPKSSPDGLMAALYDELGVISSVQPVTESTAGHCNIVCDVDSEAEGYAELKEKIINKIGLYATTGLVYSGSEQGNFIAKNGQNFNIAYGFPADLELYVKIIATVSRNTKMFIPIENVIINMFEEKFKAAYRLGFDFESGSYICTDDLPWASNIEVQYSTDGTKYQSGTLKLEYNQKVILKQVTAEIIDE